MAFVWSCNLLAPFLMNRGQINLVYCKLTYITFSVNRTETYRVVCRYLQTQAQLDLADSVCMEHIVWCDASFNACTKIVIYEYIGKVFVWTMSLVNQRQQLLFFRILLVDICVCEESRSRELDNCDL